MKYDNSFSVQQSPAVFDISPLYWGDFRYPLHLVTCFTFAWIEEGELEILLPEETLRVHSGECYLIEPNRFHGYHTLTPCKGWFAFIGTGVVPAYCTGTMHHFLQRPVVPATEEMIRLCRSIREHPNMNIYKKKAVGYAVCGEFFEKCPLRRSDDEDGKMYDVLHYIRANCTNGVTLASTAAHFGYVYQYFSRKFHAMFHMPFPDLVNSFRMDLALMMMDQGGAPITAIASHCGFGSVRSFNRVFLQNIGCTPREYLAGMKHHPSEAPARR